MLSCKQISKPSIRTPNALHNHLFNRKCTTNRAYLFLRIELSNLQSLRMERRHHDLLQVHLILSLRHLHNCLRLVNTRLAPSTEPYHRPRRSVAIMARYHHLRTAFRITPRVMLNPRCYLQYTIYRVCHRTRGILLLIELPVKVVDLPYRNNRNNHIQCINSINNHHLMAGIRQYRNSINSLPTVVLSITRLSRLGIPKCTPRISRHINHIHILRLPHILTNNNGLVLFLSSTTNILFLPTQLHCPEMVTGRRSCVVAVRHPGRAEILLNNFERVVRRDWIVKLVLSQIMALHLL